MLCMRANKMPTCINCGTQNCKVWRYKKTLCTTCGARKDRDDKTLRKKLNEMEEMKCDLSEEIKKCLGCGAETSTRWRHKNTLCNSCGNKKDRALRQAKEVQAEQEVPAPPTTTPDQAPAPSVRKELICQELPCYHPACWQTFKTTRARMLHCQRKHPGVNETFTLLYDVRNASEDNDASTACFHRSEEQTILYQRQSIVSLTNWELEHFVPRSVKQRIKEDVQDLHALNMGDLKAAVQSAYSTAATDASPPDLDACFDAFSHFWPGLETQWLEGKMVQLEMPTVKPEQVHLGQRTVLLKESGDSEGKEYLINDTCLIFPFKEQFEMVLKNEHLYEALKTHRKQRFKTSRPDEVNSVFTGQKWQKDPFFSAHTDAYTILFYYDDVTVTNPLGSYKRKV